MKKLIVGLSLAIAMAGVVLGQKTGRRARTTASNETSASKQGRQVNLRQAPSETVVPKRSASP